MPPGRIAFLTLLAMFAFAGNSLLCRLALASASIDPAVFTVIRLLAGAVTLWLILLGCKLPLQMLGSWRAALALTVYAASFSYGYIEITAATGALLLFAAVQATMVGVGLWRGERLALWQMAGFAIALLGLLILLMPGLTAPPLLGTLLMLLSGIAWGIYSLLGKGQGDPLSMTAGNFSRALVLVAPVLLASFSFTAEPLPFTSLGIIYAVLSGAVASGMGYAVWYSAIKGLEATTASVVQLSVPLITAVGGVVFLGEMLSVRLLVAAAAILGGIALVIVQRKAVAH